MKKQIATLTALMTLPLLTSAGGHEAMPYNIPESRYEMTAPRIDRTAPDNVVQIALLLDTSNSMDGLINQAKAQLWDIVNQFTYARCGNGRPLSLQIALYQYGNDALPPGEGYIEQVTGFSTDLDELSENLFGLRTNGGEEYCGEVIHTSLRQLNWQKQPGTLKMIFIAGNEPFTQGKLDYRDAVANAREHDVVVNTIYCGNYEQGIQTGWKRGADLAGGEYTAIDHNREILHIATPYDDIIIRLNSRLNNTYISYGARGAAKSAMQAEQDANALAMEEVVAVQRAVSKSSVMYDNAEWDLVDASKADGFDIRTLKKEQLPESLRDKSPEAIAAFIEEKGKERLGIRKEIRELNAKREAFLAKQTPKGSEGLQAAMFSAIKKQAGAKAIRFE